MSQLGLSQEWQLAAPQGLAFFLLIIFVCAGSSLLLQTFLSALGLEASSTGTRLLTAVAPFVAWHRID